MERPWGVRIGVWCDRRPLPRPSRLSRSSDLPALHRFEAGLAFLLGARFADPHHVASHGAERIVVQDEFDRLSAPQPEIPVEPEPAFRGIHDQTGNSRLVSFEVDDQAGALLRRNPLQAAALRHRKRGHLRPSRPGTRLRSWIRLFTREGKLYPQYGASFRPWSEVAIPGPKSFRAGPRFPQPLREHVDQGRTTQQGEGYECP